MMHLASRAVDTERMRLVRVGNERPVHVKHSHTRTGGVTGPWCGRAVVWPGQNLFRERRYKIVTEDDCCAIKECE